MSNSTNEMRARNRKRLVGMGLLAPDRYTELTGEQAPSMHDGVDANETRSLDDLKRELASLQSPEERRKQAIAEATTQRDKDLQYLANAEALAKAGAGPEVQKAITAQYQEERRKVSQRFEQRKSEIDRLAAASSTSKAVATQKIAHGIDEYDRFSGPGMVAAEAHRRRRAVEDRFEVEMAAARNADEEARRHGRTTNHTQPVRDRIADERAKVDRWERTEGENWARQQIEAKRSARASRETDALAARRRDLADQIARHPDKNNRGG